jgi:hypothetical protein
VLEEANQLDQLEEDGIAPARRNSVAVARDYYTEPQPLFRHDSEEAKNRLSWHAGRDGYKVQHQDHKTRPEADDRHAQQREQ